MAKRTVQAERDYTVRVVNPASGQQETVQVRGADDWKASTKAMLTSRVRFAGEMPEYWEVLADGSERRMCQRDSAGAQHYEGDGWKR